MEGGRVVPDVGTSISASSAKQQDISPWLFEDAPSPPQPQFFPAAPLSNGNETSPGSTSAATTSPSSKKKLQPSRSSSNIRKMSFPIPPSTSSSTASSSSSSHMPFGTSFMGTQTRVGGGSAGSTLNPSTSASHSMYASRPITPPRSYSTSGRVDPSTPLLPPPVPGSRMGSGAAADAPSTPASVSSQLYPHPASGLSVHHHLDPSAPSSSSSSSFSSSSNVVLPGAGLNLDPTGSNRTIDGLASPVGGRRNASTTTLGLDCSIFGPSSSSTASASTTHLPPSFASSPVPSPINASTTTLPAIAAVHKRSKNPFNFLKKKGSSVLAGRDSGAHQGVHQQGSPLGPTSSPASAGGSNSPSLASSVSMSVLNRLQGHGHPSNGAPGTRDASGSGTPSSSNSTATVHGGSNSRHASSGHSHNFLHLGLGSHGHHVHHGHHAHGHARSHSQTTAQATAAAAAAAHAAAIGLDQEHLLEPEQLAAQQHSSKSGSAGHHRPGRLRLGRPRTRDKDSGLASAFAPFASSGAGHPSSNANMPGMTGHDDDLSAFAAALSEKYASEGGNVPGGNTASSAGGLQQPSGSAYFPFGPVTPSNEIDFSLDTNFDQIDDIVDLGSSATTVVSGIDTRSSAESAGLSPNPLGVGGKPSAHAQSLSSASAPSGSLLFERTSVSSKPLEALRELDGSGAAGASADALERSRMAQMLALRKGSATSAGSRRSGISPKSSYANLPNVATQGQQAGGWTMPSLGSGVADPSYKFPARLGVMGRQDSYAGSQSLRKTSSGMASSSGASAPGQAPPIAPAGTQPSTAWMAPDSWAVQPDNSKAADAEDDSEGSEEEGGRSTIPSAVSGKMDWSGSGVGRRRRSSSAVSYITNGMFVSTSSTGEGEGGRSGTADGSTYQAPNGFLSDSRWAQRKDSVGTEPGYNLTASPRRPSDIEILDSNDPYDNTNGYGPLDTSPTDLVAQPSPTSTGLQPQQSQSSLGASKIEHAPSISSQYAGHAHHSGRGGGGAANVSVGAAAVAVAAAGKFLHRPHKLKNTRPSTAGSLHSTFRAQMNQQLASPSTANAVNQSNQPAFSSNTYGNSNATESSLALGDTLTGSGGPLGSAHRPSVGGSSEDDSIVYAPGRDHEITLHSMRRPNTAQSQGRVSFTGSARPHGHCVRIHRTDGPPITLLCPLYATSAEIRNVVAKRMGIIDQGAYRLFVRDKGSERPLGPSEKPALIQKRRLEQAGYNATDNLEMLGRTDLSYLLRFVYRLDSVPTFDSESFGNDEHTFQHLHLQGRNLEMVPIFLYRHADWIVSLDLSGNPMSDVPLDFIQACTNLRSIRLSNLALKRVPQSLRQSETLTYIDVSNNRIPDLSHIALDEAVELLSFKVQNNRLTELPSYFARIETLRYLNISNNRFETFPPVLCEMPFLVDLDVSFNAISSLPQEIGRMVKMQRLALVGNALESLPDSMAELASLESIDVRRNMLLDVSVLFRLPNLQSLQMSHNNLKNVDAEFASSLRILDFGQNQLTKVKIVVPAASELTVLNLTSADIDKFDDSLFSQLPNLTDLVLDRNRQFSDLTESVAELRSLVRLSCNNTRLARLPDAIGKLTKLKVLEVHNNNLKTLPSSIWNCGELEYINISANIVQSFPFPPMSGSFDGSETKAVTQSALVNASPTVQQERKGSGASFTVPPGTASGASAAPLSTSLKKLRLCDNRFTDDVFNVLSRFVNLEVLNLSFNEIYEVPAGRLSKNVCLQELFLSGNSLSSIPTEDITQLRELQTLYINGNKLQTLPAELGQLRKLVNLDVGNNNLKYNIANWNYDWNWNSNLELRFLNLSGNKRLEIKAKTETVNGRQRNVSDFSRLTNLRLLGLMDVTFTAQSVPDESDNRRVRTSLSQINEMAYGIADTLGRNDSLSIVDVVIPQFRKKANECLFGLFAGRGHGSLVGSRIANHLAEWVGPRVEWEHQRVTTTGETKMLPDVLRRAFLRINKELADTLMSEGLRQDGEIARVDDGKPAVTTAMGSSARHHWCAGASAVLAYVVDKTLYLANAGDALAVLSRNRGDAHLISTKHDPSFRDEAMRIRSAEGWVSLRGYVNDRIDVSRSFGYYHLFPIVNAAPAVQMIELTDSDEFIILANRTLWDYMSYQTAVDVARMERDDPMLAAQKLRDFAISFGAEESIMVMVISVADLFYDRQQRRALTDNLLMDKYERPRFRRDLPGDRVLARLPIEIPAPVGQLALVFTDIKNSTSLWETNPGMHAAIRLHTSLLRRQLHIIGGYEVKTEGDAFMVSFPTISSAMHWCFTIQLQLLREDWPQEILDCEDGKEVFDSSGELIYRGLSVRMGIHWGAPVCELDPVSNRMDYFGPIVNRAARISGAADGGQIMASKDVVNELKAVLDTLDESGETGIEGDSYRLLQPGISRDVVQLRRLGFGISEVGERKLKGLENPELLYQVFPTALAGRLEAKADAPALQVFEPTVQLLNTDEIKQLGLLCLRLEALSSGRVFPGIGGLPAAEAETTDLVGSKAFQRNSAQSFKMASDAGEDAALQASTHTLVPNLGNRPPVILNQDADTRRKVVEEALAVHPELLVYAIRDDATDEEMARILEQLTTRIHNSLSTLVLRRAATAHGLNLDSITQKLLLDLLPRP
ncbi:cysteinyl-tRNA synthetase [Tilletia horrida]|uniref:Adenylate cyclase n=1 Tax=Tilletia horrida TaxID=155126 RepID=A0AAN6GVW2_9BASI|nr:cysteinyl-tRNA synthetase [Tilletia horrida]KAK0557489.1 cysteinyl-tRNA synthetase [Tilletia horrida]KAK0567894.1 cysteinyl-tRNA synthetase [Tilletia horrida]